jgi:Tol biopolymer transport system component
VREGIAYASTFGFAQLDVSRTGTLVYRRSTARGQRVVSLLQASGKVEPLLAKPGDYSFPRLSPDGRLLALGVAEGGTLSTVVYDRRLERTARLPPAPGILSGVFTPDGRYLVLGSARGLFWTRTDDFAKLEPLVRSDTYQVPWSFSADGRHLGYHSLSPRTAFDVWTVPIEASDGALRAGEPELFLQTPFFETYPSFSPDGRWLAYASGEYGTWGVYVRPFPRRDTAAVRVSVGGGRMSRWRAQERELLYRTDDQRVMAVAYEVKDGTFLPSPPREWTPERLADTGVLSGFDLEPGGDRIVALLPADREEERRVRNQVTLVLNFGDEVKRRLTQGRP